MKRKLVVLLKLRYYCRMAGSVLLFSIGAVG